MSLPNNLKDREFQKFQADANGDTAVNVLLGAGALGSLLQGVEYDTIEATYPSAVVEVYAYKKLTVLQATITVTYTDATKDRVSTVVRT